MPVRLVLAGALIALLWSGWLGALHLGGRATLLDPVEAVSLDLRTHLVAPPAAPGDVVIVALDDATVADAGGYPIDRARLAALVGALKQAGARALAIDLLLVDRTGEQADRHLARALGQSATVIAAAGQFSRDQVNTDRVPAAAAMLAPLPIFADSARVGLVNVVTDAGGTPRHVPLVFHTRSGPAPSFALQAAGLFVQADTPVTRAGVRVRGQVLALDFGWHMPLGFYGPQGTIPTFSALDVLRGTLPAEELRGKLVVLGATATGIGDRFNTPFDAVLPGVEVQATAIANLLDGTMLLRGVTQRRVDVTAMVLLAVAGVLVVSYLPLTLSVLAYLALLFAWLGAMVVLFGQGVWLSMAMPLAASGLPVIGLVLVRQIVERRRASVQFVAQQELGRFQSPALARRIAQDPSFLKHPETRDAVILFIDLAGFTGASERLGPLRTRDILKEFHTLVVEKTARHGGLVVDFMGDGAMIGFGIPDARPDIARNAIGAAFALVRAVGDWIDRSSLQGDILGVRVGVNGGPVVLSRLGHEQQQQITATGDCVNVASRLLEVGKSFDAAIVVSAQLVDTLSLAALGLPDPDRREIIGIRGRDQKLEIALWKDAQG